MRGRKAKQVSKRLLRNAGLTNVEIAERVGLHKTTVSKRRRALGIPKAQVGKKRDPKIKVRYSEVKEMSCSEAARELGVSRQAVSAYRIRWGDAS